MKRAGLTCVMVRWRALAVSAGRSEPSISQEPNRHLSASLFQVFEYRVEHLGSSVLATLGDMNAEACNRRSLAKGARWIETAPDQTCTKNVLPRSKSWSLEKKAS